MKKLIMVAAVALSTIALQAKTLVVYYSYTNNVERIVGELRSRIQADVVEIEPVQKGLDYDCLIIGAPPWWSNMAAPMQIFLFQHGSGMAGKNIGLIVSSESSGIGSVESDARRLVRSGRFLSPNLLIRSSQMSNAGTMIDTWLRDIDYYSISAGLSGPLADGTDTFTVYSLSGLRLLAGAASTDGLAAGIYIVNGKKTLLGK